MYHEDVRKRISDCRRPSLSGTTIVVWSSVLLPPSRIAASSSSTSARQFLVFICSIALLPPSVGRSVTIVFVWSSQILPTHHRLLSCVRRLASVSVTILPPLLRLLSRKTHLHSSFLPSSSESRSSTKKKTLDFDGQYVPEAMHHIPPTPSMAAAREEAENVMFGALDNLSANTKIKPKDIGVLVVNCSLFNPTPSLSAMIVNKYKLRGNIRSFNLGGMGCSAGVIAIDLAKDMLQVHRNTYAVVVSTENITQNYSHLSAI
ncbi:hypothetical protein HN51_058225 [Arachis hypogaea]